MQRVHSFWGSGVRRVLGGLLYVTAATAMLASCGTEPSSDDSEPGTPDLSEAHQSTAAAAAAAPAAENAPPKIATLFAIPQETITSRTVSLLEATLAPEQTSVAEVTVESGDGKPVILRDDGLNGDKARGDGIFSATTVLDLAAEQAQHRAVAAALARNPQLTEPVFDGREQLEARTPRPLPDSVFVPGSRIPLTPIGLSVAIDFSRSLVIRHTSVVNDPTRTYDPCTNTGNPAGVWTFNHLMTEMANQPLTGITPANFTRRWLSHWENPQIINAWTVPARPQVLTKIVTPWPLAGGQLDMTKAGFKLVAIVNRLDLGAGTAPAGYGGSGAGELRFVFAAVDRSGGGCSVGRFLVIFEYGVPKSGCNAVKTWAQGWENLSTIALGTAAFNAALQALTQQVVLRNLAPSKPNGSAINQIRTNENMLLPTWELREFRLFAGSVPPNHLMETTMALTPGDPRNNTALLANFINTNTAAILAGTYTVPLSFAATNFQAGNSLIPNPLTMFWNAPGITNLVARHKFSQNTCNSCHGREMNTTFTHIAQNGALSPFLSGPMSVTDPVSGVIRSFNEPALRASHLSTVANQSCTIRALDVRAALTH